jgi:hypothetical protein
MVKTLIASYDKELEEKFKDVGTHSTFLLYREDEEPYDTDEDELFQPDWQAVEIGDVEYDAFDELLLTEPILMREVLRNVLKLLAESAIWKAI